MKESHVIRSAFQTWDGETETEETLQSIVACTADDLEIASDALDTDMPAKDAIVRSLRRTVDRLRMGLELESEQESEEPLRAASRGNIPAVATPWIVPLRDGKPDLSLARPATPEELSKLGWVWRDSVADAIRAMLGIPQATAPAEVEPESKKIRKAAS